MSARVIASSYLLFCACLVLSQLPLPIVDAIYVVWEMVFTSRFLPVKSGIVVIILASVLLVDCMFFVMAHLDL